MNTPNLNACKGLFQALVVADFVYLKGAGSSARMQCALPFSRSRY